MTTTYTYTKQPLETYPRIWEEIHIVDIAHALSRTIRYGGHTEQLYTVAQHSVRVAKAVGYGPSHERAESGVTMQALLHDAPEAYLGDIISPVKKVLPDFQALEDSVWQLVCARFLIPVEMHEAVLNADKHDPLPNPEDTWSPDKAKAEFMATYVKLLDYVKLR